MSHRPPKKKTNPALLADKDTPGAKPDVDERNLIDAAESASMSIEDRVRVYWDENRGFILGCIVVLLLVVVGYQALVVYKNVSERNLQDTYAALEADDVAGREAFARANSSRPIGGFTALILGDEALEAGEYDRAADLYRLAAEGLERSVLLSRAKVGEAFARIRGGDQGGGVQALNTILANTQLPQAARAEAAFHLAVIAKAEGDEPRFESLISQLNGYEHGTLWQMRAAQLQ